jgi:protein TonB
MDSARHPLRIGMPAAGTLLINGLLLGALLNLGLGRPPRHVETASLTVMSMALLKGMEDGKDGAKAAEQSAPAPASATPPPETQTAPQIPTLAPAIVPPIVAAPSALSQPAPAPVVVHADGAASPTRSSEAAAASAPAASGSTAARRGAADGLDANAPAGNSRAYAARIRSWLYAHKIYPKRARMRREEGIVRVRFVIDRAGVLLEKQIIAGSGSTSLDEEAAAMMQRASPYPDAPRDIRGDRIEFTVPIEFTLPV